MQLKIIEFKTRPFAGKIETSRTEPTISTGLEEKYELNKPFMMSTQQSITSFDFRNRSESKF